LGKVAAAAIAGGIEVAGVVRAGSPGHDFPKRKHWEREEVTVNPPRGKTRPGKAISTAVRDGAMAGPSEFMRNGFMKHHSMRERDGEKEEKEASSPLYSMAVPRQRSDVNGVHRILSSGGSSPRALSESKVREEAKLGAEGNNIGLGASKMSEAQGREWGVGSGGDRRRLRPSARERKRRLGRGGR